MTIIKMLMSQIFNYHDSTPRLLAKPVDMTNPLETPVNSIRLEQSIIHEDMCSTILNHHTIESKIEICRNADINKLSIHLSTHLQSSS